MTNADGSYWVYTYDALGQVTGGGKRWSDGSPVAGQQFEYAFDDIGNRQWTKAGQDLDTGEPHQAQYWNNALNQITFRQVPGFAGLSGTASEDATVSLNYRRAVRQGEYWWAEAVVTNANGPAWMPLEMVGAISNATGADIVTNLSGHALLPRVSQQFLYDADGNLTSDSLWTNTWNGENRRVTIESVAGVPAAAKRRVQWTHLGDGRWIERIVSTNNGTSYFPAFTNRYVWDGQVLLAVLDHTNGLVMSFMRGVDLSGTPQGAGGVGGLLFIGDFASAIGHHAVAYDGNGNVTALADAASGEKSARYEYGPFGEVIRMTGPMAKLNPIRFSAQYADDVTGDVKYLFRDYGVSEGRWRSRDSIEERGGANLYGFVHNEPLTKVDLHGQALITILCLEEVARAWVGTRGMPDDLRHCIVGCKISAWCGFDACASASVIREWLWMITGATFSERDIANTLVGCLCGKVPVVPCKTCCTCAKKNGRLNPLGLH